MDGELAFVAAARAVADASGCVVLTMTNFGFVDLAANLLASMPASARAHTLLVTLDAAAHDHFAAQPDNVAAVAFVRAPRPAGEAVVYSGDAAAFGSVGFIGICHEKAWLVTRLLRAGLRVLWTDTDIVWLDDARLRLAAEVVRSDWPHRVDALARLEPVWPARARIARPLEPLDLAFQADDDGLCAGFFYAAPTAFTLAFMDSVLRFLNPLVCDQMSMRRFVDEPFLGSQLNAAVLDRLAFPNGTAFFDLKAPQRLSVQPCIVHNNCIIGHDSKVRRFVDFGLWRLAPPRAPLRELPLRAWQPAATLRGHRELVGALCVLADGSLLSGSHDKSLRTWTRERRCAHIEYVHKRGGVWALAEAPDALVYTGSHDRTAAAWRRGDDGAWSQVALFAGHTRPVNALCLAGDDALVTASDDGTLRSWNRLDASKLKVFVGHTACVTAVAAAGGAVFSAAMDGSVRAWQLSTARCMQMYVGHSGWVRCLAVDGAARLFSGGADRTVREWDQRSGDCVRVLQFDDSIACLARLGDAQLLVACDRGAVFVLATRDGTRECVREADSDASGALLTSAAVLERGGDAVALGFSDGTIQIVARSLASASSTAEPM